MAAIPLLRRLPWSALAGLALALLSGGCRTADSSHWNLNQLHEADGSTSRVGELRNGFQQAMTQFIGQAEFRIPFLDKVTSTTVIEDPLSACLRNLNGLLVVQSSNDLLLAKQTSMLVWLSYGCGYSLSRERCALALGRFGKHYGTDGPLAPDSARPFATPEELGKIVGGLIQAAAPEIIESESAAQTSVSLVEQCRLASDLNLERNGARRLLLSCAALLARTRANVDGRQALVDLQRRMGKQCLGFALQAAVQDDNVRVRAAALGSWIEMTGGSDARPFALAFRNPSTENIQVAVAGIATYGLPEIPQGTPESQSSSAPQATERYWSGIMTDLLDNLREGPAAVALCRGMSQLTGQPNNLRPEHWIAWHLDQAALPQNTPSTPH